MAKSSIPLTTFTCPKELFELTVLLFGLKQAPSIFQRKMDSVFGDLSNFCIVYVDDVLVFSKTKEEHVNHLRLVSKRFFDNGMILSEKKIE
ncbi:hypothetical protein Pint_25885 [Pistacia integerrima]|uniref:Uncharacterized protein n=1 Tax=Pistacia integerrima TaxID=434235 RepID=A0ACC0YC61_9ROSI|nr:hypothetical protein Pint_25885 [Pistacia integerrima]